MRRITVMSSRGQIVVPIEIRRQLKWNAGTQLMVEWSSQSRRLVLSPVKERGQVVEFKIPPAGILRDVYPVSTTYIAQLRKEADQDTLS
ncbi:MAG: AbrB/MazE/SpoVT family DNA-binding domain-containing protein [Firmicutes bacterium]|nr:AbrB/MazE/SpoVT family DNA-binding domain-containing protein [Bacillota bacterium]